MKLNGEHLPSVHKGSSACATKNFFQREKANKVYRRKLIKRSPVALTAIMLKLQKY